MPKVSS
jgi:C-8 sterol isomerase